MEIVTRCTLDALQEDSIVTSRFVGSNAMDCLTGSAHGALAACASDGRRKIVPIVKVTIILGVFIMLSRTLRYEDRTRSNLSNEPANLDLAMFVF